MRKLICLATNMLFLLYGSKFAQPSQVTSKVGDTDDPVARNNFNFNDSPGQSTDLDNFLCIYAATHSLLVASVRGYKTRVISIARNLTLQDSKDNIFLIINQNWHMRKLFYLISFLFCLSYGMLAQAQV